MGPPGTVEEDHTPQVHWVAAESLDAALLYLRRRHDDFPITEVRFLGMIPLLSGSPLDWQRLRRSISERRQWHRNADHVPGQPCGRKTESRDALNLPPIGGLC